MFPKAKTQARSKQEINRNLVVSVTINDQTFSRTKNIGEEDPREHQKDHGQCPYTLEPH